MNQVLYRLWLWFWHLLPANPILIRVVYGASRRTRHLWIRVFYLSALLGVVLISLIGSMQREGASLAELAKGASQTFMYASMAQLALMCFLAPVFTASAITQERDAQTFNILLSTPLSNAQIVLGSLISRLYFVIMLLIAGLPIFLSTMVYGGVAASQIVESFALSGTTAVLTGALAIFIAMLGVGTRRTIFSFYLLIGLYLLSVYLLGQWDRTWVDASPPNVAGQKMSWLTPLHPFLALDVALNRLHAPPTERLDSFPAIFRLALAYPSATYLFWTCASALLLTAASVIFVRRGAKTGEATFAGTLLDRLRIRRSAGRARAPRSVWNNPVAWREAKTRAASGGLLRWALITAGFVGPLIIFFYHLAGAFAAQEVSAWLSAMILIQFALALIVATNTAATALTREKESKTLDLLLTTPLTSKYILWGKLRGLVSFAIPLLCGPAFVLLLFGIHGFYRRSALPAVWIETAIEAAILLVIYTAMACIAGLRVSLTSRSNAAAVMSAIGLLILVCGLASMIGFPLVSGLGPEGGAFFAPFTPFTSIWFLAHPAGLFDTPREFADGANGARIAAFCGCVVATGIYAAFVWNRYMALVRGFDMIIRKQSGT